MSKLLILLTGVALLSATFYLYTINRTHTEKLLIDETLQAKWNQFKQTYQKKYSEPDYEQYRIQIFQQNLKAIENEENLGITKFMDLTPEEFRNTYLTLLHNQKSLPQQPEFNDENVEINWVSKGAITPIKDQGQCGSCWAFSTTGGIEGAIWKKTGKLVSLSEQYLVDCAKNGNYGCNGGLMDNAFQYVEKNGIPTEADYPYNAVSGLCKKTQGTYKISDHKDVEQQDCNDLLKSLQVQPVSIAVDANAFQFYSSGILTKCGSQLDHGVLLVGYSAAGKYWTVKNSWGANWGENGYIRLAAGDTCGLCNMASYPLA